MITFKLKKKLTIMPYHLIYNPYSHFSSCPNNIFYFSFSSQTRINQIHTLHLAFISVLPFKSRLALPRFLRNENKNH